MSRFQHTVHYPAAPGQIYFYKVDAPYGCFSNFSPHSIVMPTGSANELAGVEWATVEHYYQAHKFLGTKCEHLMAEIQSAPSPELAAKIGRDPVYQMCPDWDLTKCGVMYRAVLQKFTTHAEIQQVLLDTLDAEIIEDSPVDRFWGCGIDRSGLNHLGRILMRVRAEIRNPPHPSGTPPGRGFSS
jgi:N-glycosidase YbiA